MAKDNLNITSTHLSSEDLLRFHRQQLSGEERIQISRHLESCELCSDALKGISEMKDALKLYSIVNDLKLRMKKRKTIRKKIFSSVDLVTILIIFFILGLLVLLSYYFVFTL